MTKRWNLKNKSCLQEKAIRKREGIVLILISSQT
jgi:hypothetical protein